MTELSTAQRARADVVIDDLCDLVRDFPGTSLEDMLFNAFDLADEHSTEGMSTAKVAAMGIRATQAVASNVECGTITTALAQIKLHQHYVHNLCELCDNVISKAWARWMALPDDEDE